MGAESSQAAVCVVGAGAAGLWAAARAARAGARVLLLEKTPRTGTKVLASGGTRCNLTTTLDARAAAELFGREGARFLGPAFRALSPADVRARFAALGVETVEEPLEKIFPKSGSAREVRDALLRDAEASGATIRCGAGVERIAPLGDGIGSGGWEVLLANGSRVECARLVLSPGGKSYARTGTTGDGYPWLAALGLPIVEPVPALVPLASPAAWVRELSGIAVQDVEARLVDPEGRTLGKRRRPVLFTHQGLSGPGAMDLSAPVARAEAEGRVDLHHLRLDLAPDLDREALRALLVEAAGRPGAPGLTRVLAQALAEPLPRRLVEVVASEAGLGATDPRPNGLDRASRHRLVETLKGLDVPVERTLGFDQAEVTAGGLALTHVDPGTMRVRGFENLYACGEILDLQGPIGGLNFQSAFATAEIAALAASAATTPPARRSTR
jgi:predicted Rossmann fold flavoprotein